MTPHHNNHIARRLRVCLDRGGRLVSGQAGLVPTLNERISGSARDSVARDARFSAGFTLIEILIAMAITAMSLVFVTYFTVDISNFGTELSNRLSAEVELQMTLRTMISEIRSIGPGGNGAYPIATATATSFTFYSDIDGDGAFEQVRYFLDGTMLKKGVTDPTTTEPVQYPSANEVISETVHDMVPGTVFTYYPEGLPSLLPPLASPVDVSKVRLVDITGVIDKDTALPPLPTTLSITVTIRNLRGEI